MRKIAGPARRAGRDTSFAKWVLTNVVIYLCVLLVSFYALPAVLERSRYSFRGVTISLVFGYPYLLMLLVLPTIIVTSFLWLARRLRALDFRLIAIIVLAIPAAFSDHLTMAALVLSTQLFFGLVMRRPPSPNDSPQSLSEP
jgi:uncharacterized membrane protein YhaH (DUF805 family)